MKKIGLRWVAGLLSAGLLLTGAAFALYGGDSLITLSYLENIFVPDLVEQGSEIHDSAMADAYEDAIEELSQVRPKDSDYLYSAVFQSGEYSRWDSVMLETGAGFLMLSGQASVSHNGAFIDVTTGEALEENDSLTVGHRYLAGEDTTALIMMRSGIVRAGVQGSYILQGGNVKVAPFTDVTDRDWYHEAVDYVYFNQLFAGVGEDQFAPMSNMDRAMMMTVLYHLAGDPQTELGSAQANFLDVTPEKWFYSFVNWAAAQGVSAGTGDGMFSPNLPVTREQVIVLLYNFATNYMGMTLDERADLSGFSDRNQVAGWSADAVSWAVASGVIVVEQGGALEPVRSAARAEVASMLMNFSRCYLDD